MGTISVYKSVEVDVDVEVDIDDIIESAGENELAKLAKKLGISTSDMRIGDGDEARHRNIIAAAERAVRAMPKKPRELEDLFWHVHGVAL